MSNISKRRTRFCGQGFPTKCIQSPPKGNISKTWQGCSSSHRRTDHHSFAIHVLPLGPGCQVWQASAEESQGWAAEAKGTTHSHAGDCQDYGFRYTRMIGELRKLGIKMIRRQTVRIILKARRKALSLDLIARTSAARTSSSTSMKATKLLGRGLSHGVRHWNLASEQQWIPYCNTRPSVVS